MKISFARNSLIEVSSKDKRRIGTNVIIVTIKYIINQIIRWRHRPTSSKVGNFKPLSNRDMTFRYILTSHSIDFIYHFIDHRIRKIGIGEIFGIKIRKRSTKSIHGDGNKLESIFERPWMQ